MRRLYRYSLYFFVSTKKRPLDYSISFSLYGYESNARHLCPLQRTSSRYSFATAKKTGTTYFQRAVSVIICVTVYAIFAYEKKNLTSLSWICVILFFGISHFITPTILANFEFFLYTRAFDDFIFKGRNLHSVRIDDFNALRFDGYIEICAF